MKTIRLTEQEIELIISALGIAESKFAELHKNVAELNSVRNTTLKTGTIFWERACQFADLNDRLNNKEREI